MQGTKLYNPIIAIIGRDKSQNAQNTSKKYLIIATDSHRQEQDIEIEIKSQL